MPARPFFSCSKEAIKAKKALLKKFSPRVIINLSALRQEKLFPKTSSPALIYISQGHSETDRLYTYISFDKSKTFKKHGVLEIGPQNIKRISKNDSINNSNTLKIATFGSVRDIKLIERFIENFPTVGSLIQKNKWSNGQGFISGQEKERTKSANHLFGLKFLPSGRMERFLISTQHLDPFREKKLQRPRRSEIYKAPLLITKRSLKNTFFASALCMEDLAYTELYYGISFRPEQEFWAHYLNGIFNSKLATYFLFLIAPGLGIEREEIKPSDVKKIPIPNLGEDDIQVKSILKIEKEILTALHSNATYDELESLQVKLDQSVYNLYGLNELERILVDDMVQFNLEHYLKPNKSISVERPRSSDLKMYARTLICFIKPFFDALKERTVTASIFNVGRKTPLQIVEFKTVPHKQVSEPEAINFLPEEVQLNSILELINKNLGEKIARNIHCNRILRIHSKDSLFLLKPAEKRYWNKSAALNDADAILASSIGKDTNVHI